MVIHRNAFTSESRPGYDIQNEATLSTFFRPIFCIIHGVQLRVSFERCIMESPRIHTGAVVCGCLPIQTMLVLLGYTSFSMSAYCQHTSIRLWSPAAVVLTRLRSTALANIKVKVIHSYHCLHRFKLGTSIVNELIKLPCFIPFFILILLLSFYPILIVHMSCCTSFIGINIGYQAQC